MFESNPEAGTMTIRGPIGDFEGAISAEDFLPALQDHNGKDILINLDSPGGAVSDGMVIYNALMQYEGKVTIHVDIIAASIASAIACAADHLICNSNGQIMIHRAWTIAMGNAGTFKDLVEQLDALDGMLADIYVEKSGGIRDEFVEMMENETYLSAKQALNLNIVDEVKEIKKSRPQASSEKPKVLALAPCVIAAKAKAAAVKMRLRLDV